MRRAGRPRALADARTRAVLLAVLRVGGSRADAAETIGVTPRTIRAEAQRDPQFLNDLNEAETDGKLNLILTVREAAIDGGNWRAAAWLLERRHWQDWGKRHRGDITPEEFTAAIKRVVSIILQSVPKKLRAEARDKVDEILQCINRAKKL